MLGNLGIFKFIFELLEEIIEELLWCFDNYEKLSYSEPDNYLSVFYR